MNVLGLVQLCQFAPAGGYSLDPLAPRPPQNAKELTHLVREVLESTIAPTEGVASGIAFRASRHGNFDRLPEVCTALNKSPLPATTRLESIHMGRHLWGISRAWEWASGVHDQLDDIARRTDFHHAVAFGTLVSETTASEARAIATYLFSTARGIVLAAIRSIPLDESTGQRVLSDLQPEIAQIAARCVEQDLN